MAFKGKNNIRKEIVINDKIIGHANCLNYLEYNLRKQLDRFSCVNKKIRSNVQINLGKVKKNRQIKFFKAIDKLLTLTETWTPIYAK